METISSFEKSVDFHRTIWYYIREDITRYWQCIYLLKCPKYFPFYLHLSCTEVLIGWLAPTFDSVDVWTIPHHRDLQKAMLHNISFHHRGHSHYLGPSVIFIRFPRKTDLLDYKDIYCFMSFFFLYVGSVLGLRAFLFCLFSILA
jgi:hypothetical protein